MLSFSRPHHDRLPVGDGRRLPLPPSHMLHQVFIIFVLGGMVAGTVGLFSSLRAAYFCFSIPTVLPTLVHLYLLASSIHLAMGMMLAMFWLIMMVTALGLHREIADALNLKYENLDLIVSLEKEIKDRTLAEERLLAKHQEIESIVERRTAELVETNQRLRDEIEDRKKAEAALRHSEERFRELSDALPQTVFETDTRGTITFISKAASHNLGYTAEEFLKGMSILDLIVPEERPRVVAAMKEIFSGQPTSGNEYTSLKKDGGTLPVAIHSNPIFRDNKPVGIRGLVIDLREKKAKEEKEREVTARLQRAEKMETLGLMAGGVAHDLNNILSGILSYPELLLMQIPENSPLRKPLTTIQAAGNRAAAIVQDLLTLTRRGVVVEHVVNLNDIVREYLKSPEHEKIMAFHPEATLDLELEKGLLNILGSPIHLTKTVMNLVSNAAEALPQGGRIRLTTRHQYLERPVAGYDHIDRGDYVILSVADNGIGISNSDLNRIFEPFFTKKVMGRSGTGLGMSLVWGTVKDHKGYINVESVEGQGTIFSLYFPVTRQEAELGGGEGFGHIRPGKGESVLLVDDAAEQREIASAMLIQMGYAVTPLASGEAAVSHLRANKADMVILDMIMEPGMDGLDTYRKILETHPRQRAIIASGFSETERVREAQRLGAGIFIQKPYTMEKLSHALRAELEKKGLPA